MPINLGSIFAGVELDFTKLTRQSAELASRLRRIEQTAFKLAPQVDTAGASRSLKSLSATVKTEADNQQRFLHQSGQRSVQEFSAHLQKRLTDFKQYSAGWMRIQKEIGAAESKAGRDSERLAAERRRTLDNQARYENTIARGRFETHKRYLDQQVQAEERYSQRFMQLSRERKALEERQREARGQIAERVGTAATTVGAAAAFAAGDTLRTGARFDDATRYAATNAGRVMSAAERQHAQDRILRISRQNASTIRSSPTELMEGLYTITSSSQFSNLRSDVPYEILTMAAQAATAGRTDVKTALGPILAAVSSGIRGGGNARLAADTIFKGVQKGQMEFNQLGGLGGALERGKEAGASLPDVMAALALLTGRNPGQTNEQITNLQNLLAKIMKPDAESAMAFDDISTGRDGKAVGPRLYGAGAIHNFGGLQGWLGEYLRRTRAFAASRTSIRTGEGTRKAIFSAADVDQKLFPDQQAYLALAPLISPGSANSPSFAALRAEVGQSTGALGTAVGNMAGGPGGDLASIANTFERIKIAITPGMLGGLRTFAGWLEGISKRFEELPKGTQAGVGAGLIGVAAGGLAIGGFIKMVTGLKDFFGLFKDANLGARIASIGRGLGTMFTFLGRFIAMPAVAPLVAAFAAAQGIKYAVNKDVNVYAKERGEEQERSATAQNLRAEIARLTKLRDDMAKGAGVKRSGVSEDDSFLARASRGIRTVAGEATALATGVGGRRGVAEIDAEIASRRAALNAFLKKGEPTSVRGARITRYNYAGDPHSDSLTRGGWGAFGNRLREGSIALSPDMERQARGMGIAPKGAMRVRLSNGQVVEGYFDDRTAANLRGRVDLSDPSGKYRGIDGARITGILGPGGATAADLMAGRQMGSAGQARGSTVPSLSSPRARGGLDYGPDPESSKSRTARLAIEAATRRSAADAFHASHGAYENARFDADQEMREAIRKGVDAKTAARTKALRLARIEADFWKRFDEKLRPRIAQAEAARQRLLAGSLREAFSLAGASARRVSEENKDAADAWKGMLGEFGEGVADRKRQAGIDADAADEAKREDFYARNVDPYERKRFDADLDRDRALRRGVHPWIVSGQHSAARRRIDTDRGEAAKKGWAQWGEDVNEAAHKQRMEPVLAGMRRLGEMARTTRQSLTGLFEGLLTNGKSTFRQLGEEFKGMIVRMIAQAAAMKVTDWLFGKQNAQGGRRGGALGNLFGLLPNVKGMERRQSGGWDVGTFASLGAALSGKGRAKGGWDPSTITSFGGALAGKGILPGDDWMSKLGGLGKIGGLGQLGPILGLLAGGGGMGLLGKILGGGGGLLGGIRKVFRFDDPVNDRSAVRWGADFAKYFAQGAEQGANLAGGGITGRSARSGAAAAGGNVILHHYGDINNRGDLQHAQQELAWGISMALPVATPGT